MKNIIFIMYLLQLYGCTALDSSGKCYYAETPKQYLTNAKGQYINENGEVVPTKVLNPEYQQFLKCNGVSNNPKTISSLGSIKNLLKDSYVINGENYTLLGQRQIKPGGGYIKSTYGTSNNTTQLQQEIFTYVGPKPFYDRFLTDINHHEGKFTSQSINGIRYIIGKNNHNHSVIYLVKNVLDSEISIVQLISKETFKDKDIPQLVRDLNQV